MILVRFDVLCITTMTYGLMSPQRCQIVMDKCVLEECVAPFRIESAQMNSREGQDCSHDKAATEPDLYCVPKPEGSQQWATCQRVIC